MASSFKLMALQNSTTDPKDRERDFLVDVTWIGTFLSCLFSKHFTGGQETCITKLFFKKKLNLRHKTDQLVRY